MSIISRPRFLALNGSRDPNEHFSPNFRQHDKEGAVQQAEAVLAAQAGTTPLLAAAQGLRDRIRDGGTRPPARAALVRFWTKHHLLRAPVPLTGARALRAEASWDTPVWIADFLSALAGEAADALDLLSTLERAWFAARRAVAGRRRTSRAAAAVDILAAAPLVSATTLAAGLGMAVKNAAALLDDFHRAGIAVEVTHRAKRRLLGLTGLAPLRAAVRPPYRPDPARGRGRPRRDQPDDPADSAVPALPVAPLTPIDRRSFDYSDLGHWMTQMDEALRRSPRVLGRLPNPGYWARTPSRWATVTHDHGNRFGTRPRCVPFERRAVIVCWVFGKTVEITKVFHGGPDCAAPTDIGSRLCYWRASRSK
jgi:hypothetical protein